MLCIKLVNYLDKYTEMQHGQQNVQKKCALIVKGQDYKNIIPFKI